MARSRKKKKDFTILYIVALTAVIIVLIMVAAYATQGIKLPQFLVKKSTPATIQPETPLIRPNPNLQQDLKEEMKKLPPITYKSVSGDGRVKYKIDRFKKLDVQPLEFEVFDENKKPYTPVNLETVRGSKMHYIVVSAGLSEFQHLYPRFENGKWKVLAKLPNPGVYYAFIDIAPVNTKSLVIRSNLTVRTPPSLISWPQSTPDLKVNSGGYSAQLKIASPQIYQPNVLSFFINKNDSVVKNIQPYLEAFGDVVIFRQGDLDSFFMYAQPLSNDPERGLVEFSTTFILSGRYTAFAEFKIGKTLVTFPFTFDMGNL